MNSEQDRKKLIVKANPVFDESAGIIGVSAHDASFDYLTRDGVVTIVNFVANNLEKNVENFIRAIKL